MKKLIAAALILVLSGCTLFSKSEGTDLKGIAEEVLDEDQGISIQIKPID